MPRGLLHSSILLGFALFAGRLAGFFREMLLATSFGLSPQADIAIVLLMLPDLLVNLLLSGGLSAALVPAFHGAAPADAAILYRRTLLGVFLLFGGLGATFFWAPQAWIGLLAPGVALAPKILGSPEVLAVAISLPVAALSGVSTALLNARGQFFVAGCGTFFFNSAVLLALWLSLSHPDTALRGICLGILAGTFFRWGAQLFALTSSDHRAGTPAIETAAQSRQSLAAAFIAGLSAASILVLIPVVVRSAASLLGDGSLAAFNYAIKLIELPLGVLVTTVATVSLPVLTERYLAKDVEGFRRLLMGALEKAVLISGAVWLFGTWYASSAVNLLFGWGKFDASACVLVTDLTRMAFASVPWVGLAGVLAASLNASGRQGEVLKSNLFGLAVLPLLCAPGVITGAPWLLMGALPVVQAVVAMALFRQVGLGREWELVWQPGRARISFLLVLLVFGVSVLVDMLLTFHGPAGRTGDILRVFLAAAGGALALLAGFKGGAFFAERRVGN